MLKYLIVKKYKVDSVIYEQRRYLERFENYKDKLMKYCVKINNYEHKNYLLCHIMAVDLYINKYEIRINKISKVNFWTPWLLKKYNKKIVNITYFTKLERILTMFKYLDKNETKGQKFIPGLDPYGEENWEG
jgi:hypothetical protein